MNFSQLQERVRVELLRRIQEGPLTRAQIARRSGLSQPHVSRFLAGKMNLRYEAMDRLLNAFNITIEMLLGAPAARTPANTAATAFPRFNADDLADADFLTPGEPVIVPNDIFQPSASLARRPTRERWVAITLTEAHAGPMRPLLQAGDLLLVDRHSTAPGAASAEPRSGPAVFALQVERGKTLFRHVTVDRARGLFLLQPANSAYPVRIVPYERPGSTESPVLGRVVLVLRSEQFRLV